MASQSVAVVDVRPTCERTKSTTFVVRRCVVIVVVVVVVVVVVSRDGDGDGGRFVWFLSMNPPTHVCMCV